MTFVKATNSSAQSSEARGRAVPDVVAPPPRHPRFLLTDGMRAIAVLSVVFVHSDQVGP